MTLVDEMYSYLNKTNNIRTKFEFTMSLSKQKVFVRNNIMKLIFDKNNFANFSKQQYNRIDEFIITNDVVNFLRLVNVVKNFTVYLFLYDFSITISGNTATI